MHVFNAISPLHPQYYYILEAEIAGIKICEKIVTEEN